jgi:hypothetical protein
VNSFKKTLKERSFFTMLINMKQNNFETGMCVLPYYKKEQWHKEMILKASKLKSK